nr:undecaprenyldiphospho-muramoylpentapeptide beta-N-acetylglucosaminyltransferase [Rudaeicoccus suwonensis]
MTSVVLAGGGTAGHISPLLATADALRRENPDVRITVVGSVGGLEETIVPERGYDLKVIPKAAFPRRPDLAALRFPLTFRRAVRQATDVVRNAEADVVVGFGGYVCPPAFLAARRAGVPIVVHEGNARPGLATRLGARFTSFIATTFSATKLPGARLLGMPLRHEITGLDRAALRPEALREFGLTDAMPTILVTGGSLGAARINEAFAGAVAALRSAGVQVLHVTGRGKEFDPDAGATAAKPDGGDAAYVVLPYADRMELCYAAADLVVTRAGANMVCETASIGLPAVFVPLPIGNGEQRLNCADVVDAGGAIVVDNADFTADYVVQQVIPLAKNADRLALMGAAARAQGHGEADEKLVAMIHEAVSAAARS